MDYDLSNAVNVSPLRQAFANASLKTLRHCAYLENKQGQRLLLQEYKAPSNDGLGAKFIFPRLVNGQPFITTDMKEVRFYAEVTKFLTLNTSFKVSDMLYNGSLEY